jgi:hypothetical protein
MRGAIFPLPNTPSWRGAQLKHRDNFTFTFTRCNGVYCHDCRKEVRKGEMRNAYKILVGKLEGKRARARPRRRWEDNIRIILREIRRKM